MPTLPDVAIGAVVAALIAGLVSLLLIFSKYTTVNGTALTLALWEKVGVRDRAFRLSRVLKRSIGLIISKEQKTSEFRQAWIDGLRSELSAVITYANAIHGASAAELGTRSELWKVVRPDFIGINEATAKIRLRLNPKEPQAVAVLATIEALEQTLAPGRAMNHVEINALEKKLVAEAQVLLKSEWNRVRTGESTYRAARFAALAVSVACVVMLLAFSFVRVIAG